MTTLAPLSGAPPHCTESSLRRRFFACWRAAGARTPRTPPCPSTGQGPTWACSPVPVCHKTGSWTWTDSRTGATLARSPTTTIKASRGERSQGKRFEFAGTPLRVEVDATFGNVSSSTNRLDPEGLDETAVANYQWLTTVRAGVEDTFGGLTLFATGGLAAARIDNSVTDIDFGPNTPRHRDPDDSFRDSSTHLGWVIGVGVETALPDAWTLRLEGSYLDFGRDTYYVNRSGNNACCGTGTTRRPVTYHVENSLGIVRLAVIRRFGP